MGEGFKDRHANRNPHFNLLTDDASWIISEGCVNFYAAVHWAGVHDEGIWLGVFDFFMIKAKKVEIFAARGDE